MLYFRCIYGYIDDEHYEELEGGGAVTPLDEEFPMSYFIPVDEGYVGFPNTFEETFETKEYTPLQFRTAAVATLESDYNNLTLCPLSSYRTWGADNETCYKAVGVENWYWFHDNAYRYIPNIVNMISPQDDVTPKTPKWCLEHPNRNTLSFVRYFPDIGKLLYPNSFYKCYDVKNGVATRYDEAKFPLFFSSALLGSSLMCITQNVDIPIIGLEYTPDLDLSQLRPENVALLSGAVNTSGSRPWELTRISEDPAVVQNLAKFYSWIFEDNPSPDSIDEDPHAEAENPYIDPDNPEKQPSAPGGGNGKWGSENNPISAPTAPTITGLGLGLFRLFSPNEAQLRQLGAYMWGPMDLNNWKRVVSDPMDAILGLTIVPVTPPQRGAQEVYLGNIPTGVQMPEITGRYVTYNCGSLYIDYSSGNTYLDYSPYTEFEIYLPFIGSRPIKADDIMGKTVSIQYIIDVMSGACIASILVNGGILYNFIGQCAISLPVSGGDWTNVLNGVLQAAGAIGSAIATQGATTPLAVSSVASLGVNMSKPQIEKSGVMSGLGGMMGPRTPYLIRTYPRRCIADGENVYAGFPSHITRRVGQLSGKVKFETVRLNQVHCTDAEKEEINRILTDEVII